MFSVIIYCQSDALSKDIRSDHKIWSRNW